MGIFAANSTHRIQEKCKWKAIKKKKKMYISRDLHNELCRLFVSSFSFVFSSSVVRPCFSSCRSVCSLETRRLAVCGGWNKHQKKVDDKKMRRKTFSPTFSSLLNGKLFDSCYFFSTPNFRSRFICAWWFTLKFICLIWDWGGKKTSSSSWLCNMNGCRPWLFAFLLC